MMRSAFAILLMCLPGLANAAERPRDARLPNCWSGEQYDRFIERVRKHPPYITAARLSAGYHIGRCLLEVRGKRLIADKCAYAIQKNGSFEIEGPRQIYRGIDYPECYVGAGEFTTDYFVYVDWVNKKEEMSDGSPGPGWDARWNGEIGSNHAEAFIGPVKRQGACFSGTRLPKTKICLWKK